MNQNYQKWLKQRKQDIEDFWKNYQNFNVDKATYILEELLKAENEDDSDKLDLLTDIAIEVDDESTQVLLLNKLLLVDSHKRHQEILRKIQLLAAPSSVPFIEKLLERGFDHLSYTGSEDEVIAKWCSWALYDINTEESIDVIKRYANSSNDGISKEMQYRLNKE